MYEFGNYANNRWQIGQLDLAILKDLGWATQNYQDLPLVDPLDQYDLVGTPGNDTIPVSKFSSTIAAGAGDDIIVLPSGTHNGNYFIDGGPGANTLVVPEQFAQFNIVSYGTDFLLQSNDGSEGVSLLRSIQHIQFSDRTIVPTAPNPSPDPAVRKTRTLQDCRRATSSSRWPTTRAARVVRPSRGELRQS